MTGLGSLGGALGILGLAVYALVQVLKTATGPDWRKTRAGRAALKASPLVLGAILAVVPGVLDGCAAIFYGQLPALATSARALLGLVAGSFSTTIHAIARRKVVERLEGAELDK